MRRRVVRWFLGGALAPLVLVGLIAGTRLAIADNAAETWQTYFDAAATAVVDNDDETAAVILNAALQTAIAQNPQGFRVALTAFDLNLVYHMLGKEDAAKQVLAAMPTAKASPNDQTVEQTDTLLKLANAYFARWRAASSAKTGDGKAEEYIRAVALLDYLRGQLLGRLRPQDKLTLGMARADEGLAHYRNGDSERAIAALQDAVRLFDEVKSRRDALRTAGRQISPLAEGESAMPSDLETDPGGIYPYKARENLALAFIMHARWKQKQEPDMALRDFQAAAAPLEQDVAQYGDVLKDQDELGDLHYLLGVVSSESWRVLKTSGRPDGDALLDKARRAYAAAIEQYARTESPTSKNTVGAAKELAKLLHESGDDAGASDIEKRYLAAQPQ
jgi:hypothetical protein